MKPRVANAIAIAIPIVVAITFGYLTYQQNERRAAALRAGEELQSKNGSVRNLIRQLEVQPIANKTIAADDSPEEQAAFLTQLRVNASASGVKLVRYMNRGLAIPPSRDPKAPIPLFRPLASNVEVQGPYMGVRAFAYSLLRADRLMNMSAVTWKRNTSRDGNTTLSFTLIRYVADPMVQPPRPASPVVAATGISGEGTP